MVAQPYEVWWASVLMQDERDRLDTFKRRWDAYAGRHPDALKTRIGGPNDNVMVNLCRPVVDKGVSFLFGEEIGFELETDETTEAEQYLDRTWRANEKMLLLQDIATTGGVTGDCYVRLYADGAAGDGRLPRLVPLDPEMVTPTWDQDDVSRVVAWRIQYNAIDPESHKPIVRRTRIEPLAGRDAWSIVDEVSQLDRRTWKQIGEAVWPYAWAPIEHSKNLPNPNEFYGTPDLADDTLHHQSRINFLASNILRIIRIHGHPRTYTTGLSNQELDLSPDKITHLPKDATIANLEMQSDLTSSLSYFDTLVGLFGVVARVPLDSLGTADVGSNISGLALKIKYQPLLEKTRTKRLTYGGLIDRLNLRILELGRQPFAQAPAIVWPEMLPTDEKAERESAKLDLELGFSQNTIIRRLGGDPDHEAERRLADVVTIDRELAATLRELTNAGASIRGAALVLGLTPEQAAMLEDVGVGIDR